MMRAKGLVAELGTDQYRHRFGGATWQVRTAAGASPLPLTLLTLDLSDPRLCVNTDVSEVPLCSRIDGASDRQSYTFDPARFIVAFEGPAWHVPIDAVDLLPMPLPMRDLRLRTATDDEDPEVGPKYEVQDTFLGGSAFLRVRGEPIWLGDREEVRCSCGQHAEFMAAIGYENYERPSGIVSLDRAFFIGEVALYFFACLACRCVVVVSQPS
jgi:hypothetical protein